LFPGPTQTSTLEKEWESYTFVIDWATDSPANSINCIKLRFREVRATRMKSVPDLWRIHQETDSLNQRLFAEQQPASGTIGT
jgi:hypothetical protein